MKKPRKTTRRSTDNNQSRLNEVTATVGGLFSQLTLWFFGLLLIIFALIFMLLVHIWAGLIWLIAGILLLPPIMRRLKHSKKRLCATSFTLVLIGLVFAIEQGSQQSPTLPKNNPLNLPKLDDWIDISDISPKTDNPPQANKAEQANNQAGNERAINTNSKPKKTTTTPKQINCKIIAISDGDTATCLNAHNEQLRVRLSQIDAPEKSQAYGQTAKRALSDLIYQKNVQLKVRNTDKYGRYVSEIYLNNQNINKQMVASGMAWAYVEYLQDDEYLLLEQQARVHQLGLWADKNPIYPSNYRKSKNQSKD